MTRPLRILSHLPLGLLQRVKQDLPGVEIIQIPEKGELPAGVEGEVLLTQAWGSPNMAEVVKRVVMKTAVHDLSVREPPIEEVVQKIYLGEVRL